MWLRLTGSLLCTLIACDNSSPQPPSRLGSHPAGQLMKLTPANGPFTRDELLQIAYHYHPRMERLTFRTVVDLYRYERATPEYQARDTAHDDAMADRGPWNQVVDALAGALPDKSVHDATVAHVLEPAYVVEVAIDTQPARRVVGMVSALAPIFIVYESVAGKSRVISSSFSPDSAAIAQHVEREILARFPYHRLDPQLGTSIVPGIQVGNLQFGETTLIDALFTQAWW